MFYVGQRVCCVDDRPAGDGYQPPISCGKTYTVIGLCHEGPELGLHLAGVSVLYRPGWTVSLRSERFRPIVERNTDISIFKAMLNPKTTEPVR